MEMSWNYKINLIYFLILINIGLILINIELISNGVDQINALRLIRSACIDLISLSALI